MTTADEEPVLHLLFVCTGNICRSPTAERLAAIHAARLQIPQFTTSSAGTRAVVGHPIHPDAAAVLEDLGGDASDFSARQLSPRIASAADLVITMTRSHRDVVLELAPRMLHRTFTLAEAAEIASEYPTSSVRDLSDNRPQLAGRELADVADPIGRDPDVFVAVGSHIAALLPPILNMCRRSAERSTR